MYTGTMKIQESDMKRMKRLFLMVHAIQAVLILCAAVVSAQGQEQVAFVLSINGKLEIRHTSTAEWIAAKTKDPLYNGSQLRTATGDKAIIIYPASGSRVLVYENTTIEIHVEGTGAGAKPSVERTRLLVGEIYNQARGNYEVETPSSVASVRGTDFNVRSTPQLDTFVGVQGIIGIMNQFGSVILNQFQVTSVQPNQPPAQPTNLTPNETNLLIQSIMVNSAPR